jgi:hypothetical protein
MATRNCVEHVQDDGITKQGRDDRRRSLQDGAHVTNVEVPDLEGPLIELICAENPNSFFAGQPAIPIRR